MEKVRKIAAISSMKPISAVLLLVLTFCHHLCILLGGFILLERLGANRKIMKKKPDHFRELLLDSLEKKSLSIRKLGELSGIDHATISKIMNGKRKANLTHLQKLSESLGIELTTLMKAAGYNIGMKTDEDLQTQESLKTIQHLVKTIEGYDGEFTLERIRQEISNYEDRSQTKEGRAMIRQGFQDKLDNINPMSGNYINKLKMMYSQFISKKGTVHQLRLMGAALLYFIVTTDLVPDYLFAVGLLDDAFIIQTILQHLENKEI